MRKSQGLGFQREYFSSREKALTCALYRGLYPSFDYAQSPTHFRITYFDERL